VHQDDYYDFNSLFCVISFGGIGLILGDTFAQVAYLENIAFIVLTMTTHLWMIMMESRIVIV